MFMCIMVLVYMNIFSVYLTMITPGEVLDKKGKITKYVMKGLEGHNRLL